MEKWVQKGQKIQKFIFITIIIFFICGCDKLLIIVPDTNSWITPNKEFWNYQWVKGEQSDYKLSEYRPKIFSGKNSQQKKWFYPKVTFYNDYINILALEKGWLLDSNIKYGDKHLKGIVDPENGKFEEIKYIYPFLGVYDGKNVYGANLFRQTSSSFVWNAETKEIIWSNCLSAPGAKFFIVNGKLIHYTSSGGITLSRLDHVTGEVLWQVTHYEIANEIVIKTDSYLILIGKDKHGKVQLHRINPINDEIKSCMFASDYKTYSLTNTNNNVWIMLDNRLIKFDVEQFVEKNSFDIPNLKFIDTVHKKLTISNPITKTFNIFDPETETITPLDTSSAIVINNSLIFEDERQIRGINPETLETIWWIDLDENIKNAHVEWLDWRGVLVVSSNEIACYSTKK